MIWDILNLEEKNEVLLKILIHFSKVDNTINQQEFSYLWYISQSLNIEPELIRKHIANKSPVNEILPSSESERIQLLSHLLWMVNADSKINPEEENAIYHFALKLGFHEEMISDLIHMIKSKGSMSTLNNSFSEIIKKFSN